MRNFAVSIIGSGNVAWHLCQAFEAAGIEVAEIAARSKKKAENIVGYLYDVHIKTDYDFSESRSSIFIIAVSDGAIAEVADALILPSDALVVHTSGATPMSVLEIVQMRNIGANYGVLYPIMTFSANKKIHFKKVTFCLETSHERSLDLLKKLVLKLSANPIELNSTHRATLHLSAVFACNFVNHLWALSKEILEEEDMSLSLISPLIAETYKKAMEAEHPAEVQTGPAIRRDTKTLNRHVELIKEDEDLTRVYKVLSSSIQDWHADDN